MSKTSTKFVPKHLPDAKRKHIRDLLLACVKEYKVGSDFATQLELATYRNYYIATASLDSYLERVKILKYNFRYNGTVLSQLDPKALNKMTSAELGVGAKTNRNYKPINVLLEEHKQKIIQTPAKQDSTHRTRELLQQAQDKLIPGKELKSAIPCPKCGGYTEGRMQTTRSGDEGMTGKVTCTNKKCKHSFKVR
jgi:DNA-directed RNA polymerase subunit M/transcription elongation factor TFIIS